MSYKNSKLEKIQDIERVLVNYLPEQTGHQKLIMEAMEYSVMAGGKRLRPMLMKETYELLGGTGNIVEPFMAAIEMIHTYYLVHDDLPAMDNDDYRRVRKTTHVVYGEAMGILAGDALLNYAFETAAKAFSMFPEKSLQIGKAMQILAGKAGIYGMIGGQVVDVESAGKSISKEVLDFIYELKTSALIESSMMIGAILANASEEDIKAVENIAYNIGIAFQIQDDILDVIGSEEVLGKPIGSDAKNDKLTYVSLKGLDVAKEDVKKLSGEAISSIMTYEKEEHFLSELTSYLIDREK